MYDSPIELFQGDMKVELEGTILKAVANVGVNVDKEELLKALNYDREQYQKGYEDAMNDVKHPRCLKFEEIKAGMRVYDIYSDTIIKVDETVYEENYYIDSRLKFVKYMSNANLRVVPYRKGRFYPIAIPYVGETE